MRTFEIKINDKRDGTERTHIIKAKDEASAKRKVWTTPQVLIASVKEVK